MSVYMGLTAGTGCSGEAARLAVLVLASVALYISVVLVEGTAIPKDCSGMCIIASSWPVGEEGAKSLNGDNVVISIPVRSCLYAPLLPPPPPPPSSSSSESVSLALVACRNWSS